MADSLAENLAAAIGANRISTGDDERRRHGTDESWHTPVMPDVVAYPERVKDVVALLEVCRRHRAPVVPFGAGSSIEGQVIAVRGGVSVDLTRMNRIKRLSVEDLDVTVEAGVTRLALDRRLRPEGVFFSVDPGADATIGGMIGTGASGTTTVRYGTMRENVLALTIVTAEGRVVRTGSRARKSAAGYDLTRLFIGSEGTLGIVVDATLRLHPTPETIAAGVCPFPSVAAAVACATAISQLGIAVTRMELLDGPAMAAVNARSSERHAEQPTLFLEFSGSPAAVREHAGEAGEVTREHGGGPFHWSDREIERRRLWEARHRVYEAGLALRPGAKALTTDVCVPVSALGESIAAARTALDELGLTGMLLGHVGDGNFHAIVYLDPGNAGEVATAHAFHDKIVRRAIGVGGTATGEHGVGLGKARYLVAEHGEPSLAAMRAIKSALDPEAMMNPGKGVELAFSEPAESRPHHSRSSG